MISDSRRHRFALYLGIGAFVLFALLPYYWVFRATILEAQAVTNYSTPLIPIPFLFDEFAVPDPYLEMWTQFSFSLYFRNSVIVSLASTALALTFAIPGAYAFARLEFPGRQFLFYTTVFTILFPWIVLTVPVYEIFYTINLLNSWVGIVLALAIFVQPLAIWLLQGFFRTGLPANIEEAALIDGTTRVGAFFRVVLPLSLPAIAATALFAFLTAWNNFIWVFVLTNEESMRTATVALHYVLGQSVLRTEWNVLLSSLVILVLPPVVFYMFVEQEVGEGLGGM